MRTPKVPLPQWFQTLYSPANPLEQWSARVLLIAQFPLLHYFMQRVLIAPSILAADFSRLADEVRQVEQAGADWIHCDIMDGHFVDNISFGPGMVATVRKLTSLPLDVHLMIQHPDHYLPRFVDAGANSITVHVESESEHEVGKTLRQIRDAGCRAGLTLNPATPFELLEPFLGQLDLLLIMTVHPGFGGQSFRAEQMEKVRRARAWKARNNPNLDLEVDGGINPETARVSIENGANVLVAGTSIFKSKDYAAEIRALRGG
jgi:ribulose-phosphate 3-epimerase